MPSFSGARRALELREASTSAWHSALFAVCIGAPILVGIATGEVRAGIVGAIAGLLLGLADNDGPLRERFYLLARAALVLLILGSIGTVLGAYNAAFWAVFLLWTTLTGWLSWSGHSSAAPGRYGAMALFTTAGLPGSNGATVALVLVAVAASAIARGVGSALFPGASAISLGSVQADSSQRAQGVRFGLAYAATVAAGLLIGQWEGVERPVWIATTSLLVMQPGARASYERIGQRTFGTILGVGAALLLLQFLHAGGALLLLILLIAIAVPHGAARNYWLHSALVAMLVLVLYDYAAPGHHLGRQLPLERITDALIGCALAWAGTWLAFGTGRTSPGH